METIPRYSYDLIDELDRDTPTPKLPASAQMWHALDENAMRMAAFQCGFRSCVDMLVEARTEIEQEKANARGETPTTDVDESDDALGVVLDPDGNPHQTVASTHVAARIIKQMPDGDGGE